MHVLAAIVAVGANLTYSFWIRSAGHERERLAWTIGRVRRLDDFVATPAYIVLWRFISSYATVIAGSLLFWHWLRRGLIGREEAVPLDAPV